MADQKSLKSEPRSDPAPPSEAPRAVLGRASESGDPVVHGLLGDLAAFVQAGDVKGCAAVEDALAALGVKV